ncbi:MAG: 16S rRNA (guanine(966)-N(2))-methyltransferase RsmD [Selenomonadaceae bacterium]|nr:16S rRNA (guanine(966)-N(2))-methyltransferase RsmD [Selenomonadaceae bacterium]
MKIITGKAKGLNLKTPKGLSTRPTSDRIKESLFSILNGMIDFEEKIILDLFAGTGALGIESLSRGANHSTFIDKETTAIINDNVNRAHFVDQSEIIRGDVFKIIKKLANQQKTFDLIFCDPPYNLGLWQRALVEIDELNLLKVNGIFIIEHGINETIESQPKNLELIRQVKYGHTTAIDIYGKNF